LLFWCQLILAQDPFCIKYATTDGLPSNNVYSVFQDDEKFLWFTTDAGVVKFDSHSFTLYNTDNGLSDNEVFKMRTDSKGRTWFLTLNGKISFLYKGRIYNESNTELAGKIYNPNMMMDFYEDPDGTVYFTFRNGAISVLRPNDTVQKLETPFEALCGSWKSKGQLSILTDWGIFDQQSKQFNNPMPKASSFYRLYHENRQHYFSRMNQLFRTNRNGIPEKVIELPGTSEIINLYVENDQKMWVGTRNGVYLVVQQKIKSRFFEDYAISGMTKDFEGGYWLTSLKKGVLYVPSFEVFEDKLNTNASLKLNCISINDRQEIWVGTNKNYYYVKKTNEPFVQYSLRDDGLSNEICNIRFFGHDAYIANKSLFAKMDGHVAKYNFPFSTNDILVDGGYYYIGTGATYKVPIAAFAKTPPTAFGPYVLIEKRTSVLAKGGENEIWAGTSFGLYAYHTNRDQPEFLGSKDQRLQASIRDLLYDRQSKNLFVATNSQGVLIVRDRNVSNQFSRKNGLNSNSCNTIKQIGDGNYLIGSNNGLNALTISGQSYETKNLNAILGLKNRKINDIELLDGMVYLITDNGLLYFDLKTIQRQKTYPICYIRALINGETQTATKDRKFSYGDNNVSIRYVGLSYSDAKNLTYFYRLNGQSTHWTQSKETQINYSSLAPGKYTFCVYCVDGLQLRSAVRKIEFEIEAPFWRETSFILLCFGVFSLLLYWFIRHRLKQQQTRFEKERLIIKTERDKAQLEKEMIDLEQKALRLQMNPHFIFNALNTIKGYYSEGDAINASSYISKFSKLLRMLLENTDQVVPLANEIEMLGLYISLAQTRYKNKFDYKLFVDEHLNTNETIIPTLLLQPIVENAIIHGLAPKDKKGILKVYFVKKAKQLECIVEDNGIGRAASKSNQKFKEYESKAIDITSERIALFGKNIGPSNFEIIDLASGEIATGTRVIVSIPLLSIWQ
jgi:ligand-binding sensor domain-containing protein